MSLYKSICWYSNIFLQFSKLAVPFLVSAAQWQNIILVIQSQWVQGSSPDTAKALGDIRRQKIIIIKTGFSVFRRNQILKMSEILEKMFVFLNSSQLKGHLHWRISLRCGQRKRKRQLSTCLGSLGMLIINKANPQRSHNLIQPSLWLNSSSQGKNNHCVIKTLEIQ